VLGNRRVAHFSTSSVSFRASSQTGLLVTVSVTDFEAQLCGSGSVGTKSIINHILFAK